MPSPGEERRGADALIAARDCERGGRLTEAIDEYERAIVAAERASDAARLAEGLRRLAILRRHRDEPARARELCRRSYEVAREIGNDVLAAEALNTLGAMDLATGYLEQAAETFLQALDLGGSSRQLRARGQQNLGVVAHIQGDLTEALARDGRPRPAGRAREDAPGRATASPNLGPGG